MALAEVVLILIGWGIYALVKKLTPPDPPLDNVEEHFNRLMRCKNPKEMRRFIKEDAKRRRALQNKTRK